MSSDKSLNVNLRCRVEGDCEKKQKAKICVATNPCCSVASVSSGSQ